MTHASDTIAPSPEFKFSIANKHFVARPSMISKRYIEQKFGSVRHFRIAHDNLKLYDVGLYEVGYAAILSVITDRDLVELDLDKLLDQLPGEEQDEHLLACAKVAFDALDHRFKWSAERTGDSGEAPAAPAADPESGTPTTGNPSSSSPSAI